MEGKSGFRISTLCQDTILEIVVTGKVEKEEINKLNSEVFTVVRKQTQRAVLIDVRDMEWCFPKGEAFFRLRSVKLDMEEHIFAVVDLKQNARYQPFLETIAYNSGLALRWFANIECARAWLRSSIQAPDSEDAGGQGTQNWRDCG